MLLKIGKVEMREIGNGQAPDKDRAGLAVQALPMAFGTGMIFIKNGGMFSHFRFSTSRLFKKAGENSKMD